MVQGKDDDIARRCEGGWGAASELGKNWTKPTPFMLDA